MSRFFSEKYRGLVPYTPGEQPRTRRYIKLNTNESPYPPSSVALDYATEAGRNAHLYCDPDCTALRERLSRLYDIAPDEVLFTNGSDEALQFAFAAFCDSDHPAVFPDITYGFYPVFADLMGVEYRTIPLSEDYKVNANDYLRASGTVFLANPNAPTGIALPLDDIERIVRSNPDRAVVVDEAYVDFGSESAVGLIHTYDNLLITQTFSKSRSLAGARLGMAIGCAALIADLNTLKYATNPYNVNGITQALGEGTLDDTATTRRHIDEIRSTRAYTAERLRELGFHMTDSRANFLFIWHEKLGGEELYQALRSRGILVRHFKLERIDRCNRVTIGTRAEMDTFLTAVKEILEATI